MKKLVLLMMMVFCCFTGSFANIQNTNYENLVKNFTKQTTSKIEPKIMCFPTSMINAASAANVQFPMVDDNVVYTPDYIRDLYDEYLHSYIVKYWYEEKAYNYVSHYIDDLNVDPREMYDVEVAAFNSWVGYEACKLDDNLGKWELLEYLDKGFSVVMSGLFVGRNHCVVVLGYETDPNDSGHITNIVFYDPYGDPYTKYKIPGEGGDAVKMSFHTFWKATLKTEIENPRHIGIIFNRYKSRESSYKTNITLDVIPAIRQYPILNVPFDISGTVNAIMDSRYNIPSFIGEDYESVHEYDLKPEFWYIEYVKYAKLHPDLIDNHSIITYNAYVDIASYWCKQIPAAFLYPMINESLKQDVPMSYLYSISRIETMNYQYFKSLKKNKNGTTDWGLMGLNSANFDQNTWEGNKFLENYFYFDDEYESFDHKNQLHILKVCTRYLKYLIEYTGSFEEAAKAYNGGLTKWINNKTSVTALEYSESACKYCNIYKDYTVDENEYISLALIIRACDIQYDIDRYRVQPLKQFQMEVVAAKFYKSNATNIYQKFYIPNKLLIYIQDKSKRIDEIIREEGTCLGTLSDNGKYIIL